MVTLTQQCCRVPSSAVKEIDSQDIQSLRGFEGKEIQKGEYKNNGTNKLIPHLYQHKNYVIDYRNLKYLVELGIKIATFIRYSHINRSHL